jgi:hypothetical protein
MRTLMLQCLLAASLLASPFFGYAQEQSKPAVQKVEQARNKEQLGTEKSPLVIKVLATPDAEEQATKDEEHRKEKANQDWWITSSTIWLAGWTTILAVFTFLLWYATRNLLLDAKNTSKWDLRAYLSPADGKLYPITKTVLRAEISLKNSGRTPAHKVRYSITGELRSPDDIRSFVNPDLSTRNQPIAPNSHWTVGHEFLHLTKEDIQDVVTDKKWVYIWGQAEYFDVFGARQTFKFRYRNIVKKMAKDPRSGASIIAEWNFYPEEDGNEAT